MNCETPQTFELREPNEVVIKSENDGNSDADIFLNRIKIEHSVDWDKCEKDNKATVKTKIENESPINTYRGFKATEIIEQVFINNENDRNTEAMSETVLDSIKSEPNVVDYDKCDEDNKNILEMKVDESEVLMYDGIKEELIIKNEKDENTDAISGIVSSRIKTEFSGIDNLDECAMAELNIQLSEVAPETDVDIEEFKLDIEEFKVTEITEECTIKSESEISMDAVSNVPSNSMAKSKFPRKQHQVVFEKTSRKSFSCYNCNYTAHSKLHLISHLKMHDDEKYVHFSRPGCKLHACMHCHVTFRYKTALDDHINRNHCNSTALVSSKIHECTNAYKSEYVGAASSYKLSTCIHCNATFKSKRALDNHLVRKHQDFNTSIARKLHECKKCSYKTILKNDLVTHNVSEHPETTSHKLSTCIHCAATFKSKRALDDHVVKKHPNFITSVNRKIYKCTRCIYNTINKHRFHSHNASVHPETVSDYKFSSCIHCNAKFRSHTSLDDHILRKHPEFISLITSKLHECTKCDYKTAKKSHFVTHMSKHPETGYKFSTCIHCDATFKTKVSLDDHVVRKHPNFITSVVKKIYECTECTYKTTLKNKCNRHIMLMHSETASGYKLSMCIHCNATFKSKVSLDDHVVRKHPNFITSVAKKIYECTECGFKTTLKNKLHRHMSMHSGSGSTYKLSMCIHCNMTFKSKVSLDDHIVRKHPDFIALVARKIYECTECIYKSTLKKNFERHLSMHPDNKSSLNDQVV